MQRRLKLLARSSAYSSLPDRSYMALLPRSMNLAPRCARGNVDSLRLHCATISDSAAVVIAETNRLENSNLDYATKFVESKISPNLPLKRRQRTGNSGPGIASVGKISFGCFCAYFSRPWRLTQSAGYRRNEPIKSPPDGLAQRNEGFFETRKPGRIKPPTSLS